MIVMIINGNLWTTTCQKEDPLIETSNVDTDYNNL